MSEPLYVSGAFVGEMLKELLLAFAALDQGTMTQAEALGVYHYWLERFGNEVGVTWDDDLSNLKKGEN